MSQEENVNKKTSKKFFPTINLNVDCQPLIHHACNKNLIIQFFDSICISLKTANGVFFAFNLSHILLPHTYDVYRKEISQ